MAAFLFLLVKLNLAMGMAIMLVALLRRPLRAQFGAPIAYAVWFLVPVAAIASLLPPRVIVAAPVMSAPAAPVPAAIPHAILHMTLPVHGSLIAITSAPSAHALPVLLLFGAWAFGALFMALHLAQLQLRFRARARMGKAGPAVLGFIRPRIVTPQGFGEHFTPQEQAAILAHEEVHLARQDARINALAALLRCLCWFNPLIHWGARLLRIDQELACDASVVAGNISRQVYGKALLKSQLVAASLPLGCNWPGSQHPLIERVALLKHKPPGAARRLAGAGLVIVAASLAGLSAWAAQPAVVKPALPRMVQATLVAPAPMQPAAQPVAMTNPAANDNDAPRIAAIVPVKVRAPRMVGIDAPAQLIPASLPQIASIPEADPAGQTPEPKEALAKNNVVATAQAEPEPVVLPNTPDGGGDPDTIVCRAPQRIKGSDTFGDVACGHNYEWQKLALNGKDLAADDKTLIPRATIDHPTGEGDPRGVTCRTAGFFSPSPPLCRINRFWANLIKNHQSVYDDGVLVTRAGGGDFGGTGYGGPGPGDYDSGSWQSGGNLGGTGGGH